MKTYCLKCGSSTSYAGEKPKFCSSCGSPLSASANKEIQPKNYEFHEDLLDDEELNDKVDVPNMQGLDIEIEKTPSNKIIPQTPRVNAPQQSSEQIMENFRKEAGTLRNKDA
jgi:hypothetical protein